MAGWILSGNQLRYEYDMIMVRPMQK